MISHISMVSIVWCLLLFCLSTPVPAPARRKIERYEKKLDSGTDFIGVFGAFGLAAQIAGQIFSLLDDSKASTLDFISMRVQFQMAQHHNSRQQQCRWIGQILASYIGRGTMDLDVLIWIYQKI